MAARRIESRPCVDCGAVIARPPDVKQFRHVRCPECRRLRRRSNERKARRTGKRVLQERTCIDCGCVFPRPPDVNRFQVKRCPVCTKVRRKEQERGKDRRYRARLGALYNARERERRAFAKLIGRCTICSRNAERGHVLCTKHRLAEQARYARRAAQGAVRYGQVPTHQREAWLLEDQWGGDVPLHLLPPDELLMLVEGGGY